MLWLNPQGVGGFGELWGTGILQLPLLLLQFGPPRNPPTKTLTTASFYHSELQIKTASSPELSCENVSAAHRHRKPNITIVAPPRVRGPWPPWPTHSRYACTSAANCSISTPARPRPKRPPSMPSSTRTCTRICTRVSSSSSKRCVVSEHRLANG